MTRSEAFVLLFGKKSKNATAEAFACLNENFDFKNEEKDEIDDLDLLEDIEHQLELFLKHPEDFLDEIENDELKSLFQKLIQKKSESDPSPETSIKDVFVAKPTTNPQISSSKPAKSTNPVLAQQALLKAMSGTIGPGFKPDEKKAKPITSDLDQDSEDEKPENEKEREKNPEVKPIKTSGVSIPSGKPILHEILRKQNPNHDICSSKRWSNWRDDIEKAVLLNKGSMNLDQWIKFAQQLVESGDLFESRTGRLIIKLIFSLKNQIDPNSISYRNEFYPDE